MKKAIITGITGQDGAYLAELLLKKGYSVYGTYRRASSNNFWRLKELGIQRHPNLHYVEFDLVDQSRAIRMVSAIQPDEIYNLAAQSYVGASFEQPLLTTYCNGLGTLHLLEAIRIINPSIKFYQASTSEMYGNAQQIPQSENTPLNPCSPYGIAKLYAHWMTINYRESYGIYAASGILFNHESPLRGREFVTRKITDGLAKIKAGYLDHIELGNLNAKRDWGYAREYVDGIWRMLQIDTPDTFILATGRTATVRDFLTMACREAGIGVEYSGHDDDEIVRDKRSGKLIARVNPALYRPAEVDVLIGDPGKAKEVLGWKAKISLESICKLMLSADIKRTMSKIQSLEELEDGDNTGMPVATYG